MAWIALAMMGKTRLWLGGEVSEQRDMPLTRQLIVRVRRWAVCWSTAAGRWHGTP